MALENITPELARRLRLDEPRGAVIADVEEESPAQRAGLQPGDVILRVGSIPITNRADAQKALAAVRSGSTAFLRVFRGGQETFVTVKKD
jgi:S1-C subfamily serine protease